MEKLRPVPQRYADFARDCREIQELCRQHFQGKDLALMGWPMNMDSLLVDIGPRVRENTVARAAKLHGGDFYKDYTGDIGVYAPLGGHGAGRRTQLEFMAEEFRKRGYPAYVRYLDD